MLIARATIIKFLDLPQSFAKQISEEVRAIAKLFAFEQLAGLDDRHWIKWLELITGL